MRRFLVGLLVLACLAPLAAQEQVPTPKPMPTVSPVNDVPVTPTRMHSQSYMRRHQMTTISPSTTTTVANSATTTMVMPTTTTTTTMQPVYNSRGHMTGWRQAAPVAPATMSTKVTQTSSEMPKPGVTTEPVTQSQGTVTKTEGQVVQAGATQPMVDQPRRGLFPRLRR